MECMLNMHINILTHTQRPQLQGFFLQLVKSYRRCICHLAISSHCQSQTHLELASLSLDGDYLPGEKAEALCHCWAIDGTSV